MMKKSRAQRNTSRRQPYAWLGAGALGVGLALAGAGTAHADDTSAATETPSARVSASAAAAPGARAATSKSTAAVRPAAPGRSPAATSRSVPASQPVSAAARSNRLTPARVAAVSGTRVAAVSGRPAPAVSASAEASPEVPTSAPTAAAASAGVVTPAPSQATIAATNWFSSTRSWLNEFDGPLAAAAQDVLVGVQRTLFSPAPTVKPVQYSIWTPEEPILGALKYAQPGGAAVSMQLTQAPTFGTVQLLSSGAYTYTPGPDFTGTDSFTAEVTAGGFNILEPFTPRTATVAVNINPTPLLAATTGFDIKNLSGQSVMLKTLEKEEGYERDVDALPAGTIVPIGGNYHVELTDYAFYSYVTYWEFAACVEVDCSGGKVSDRNTWVVKINRGVIGFGGNYWAGCLSGRCENADGRGIDGYDRDNPYGNAYGNRTVVLVDSPGTKRTITGAQAEKQGNIISAVCSTDGSYCSFVSNGPVTPSTIGKTKIFNNNSDGQLNITQTFAEQISAQSSTKFTYSQETSGNIGVKGSWGLAFKAAFGQELSSTNSLQTTTTVQINQILPAWTRGIATVGAPADRVIGTYTARIKNTEFTLTDVWFDFPQPQSTTQSYDWTTEEIKRPGRQD
jgi:hypothetical protein